MSSALDQHNSQSSCMKIKQTMLKEIDVLLDNKAPHFPVTTTYRKKTFTGVLTNFLSFTPLCYKLGLVKTLIDRIFKINNTWLGFHKDIQKLFVILRKNLYPGHVLNSIIHRHISKAVKGDNARSVAGVEPQVYFTLRSLTSAGSRV